MCKNLVLSAYLLRSSVDILDGKLDGKIYFSGKCWSKKKSFLWKQELLENHCDICLSFLGIPFTIL